MTKPAFFFPLLLLLSTISFAHCQHDDTTTTTQRHPMPTQPQQLYADHELMALIHFNMGTYVGNGDPACDDTNWQDSHHPGLFNPYLLDTDQWATVLSRLGAKHAVLTAKHGCGFLLWPSQVPLLNAATNQTMNYTYAVGNHQSAIPYDVVQRFVDSFRHHDMGVGFYYSLKNNFWVNRKDHHFVNRSQLLPHQVLMTREGYEDMALGHLRELWTNYGNLTEHWFDNGYTPHIQERLANLLHKTQPDMVVWRGQGITDNVVGWDGTESGYPSGNGLWSTGCDIHGPNDDLDPNDPEWCPKGCDTTLQDNDLWFYEPTAGIRSLDVMMEIYHRTVGRNGVLELDVAVDTTGRIRYDHAQRYQEMGAYINECYGAANVKFVVKNVQGYVLEWELEAPIETDRIWLREDQWRGGQRIRQYKVYVKTQHSEEWILFSRGHAVGNKRIDQGETMRITALKVHVEKATDIPWFREIAVFSPCPDPKNFTTTWKDEDSLMSGK